MKNLLASLILLIAVWVPRSSFAWYAYEKCTEKNIINTIIALENNNSSREKGAGVLVEAIVWDDSTAEPVIDDLSFYPYVGKGCGYTAALFVKQNSNTKSEHFTQCTLQHYSLGVTNYARIYCSNESENGKELSSMTEDKKNEIVVGL